MYHVTAWLLATAWTTFSVLLAYKLGVTDYVIFGMQASVMWAVFVTVFLEGRK